VNRLARIFWSVYYTYYFYRKYWDRYANRAGVHCPRVVALLLFSIWSIYTALLRALRHMLPWSGAKS
jgi:hypothetical protein